MLKFEAAKKKKAWIIIGVSAAIVLGCAGVVWMDHDAIKQTEGEIAALKTKLGKAKARAAKIPAIEDRVLKERLVVKELANILPVDDDIHNFVDYITEFAKESGVEIESLDDKSARTRKTRKRTREAFVRIVYKMALKGSVSQLLDFMNRFEQHDRFVSVNQFTIKAKSNSVGVDPSYEGPEQHAVDLELETYVYNPPKQGTEVVKIVNAEQKLEKLLAKSPVTDTIELEAYDYEPNPERRDPFKDPRRGEGDEGDEGVTADLEAQQKLLDELLADLNAIREGIAQEQTIPADDIVRKVELANRINGAMVAFLKRIEEIQGQKPFTDIDLRKRFTEEVETTFAAIMAKRPPEMQQDFRLQELQSQFTKMEVAFEESRYTDVNSIAKTLIDTMPPEESLDGTLKEVYEKIRRLAARSQARFEFSQKQMAFAGYVFQPSNPSNAVVIINERAYSPGDVMDDGVVIRSVDPTRVVFLYKREEITRSLD